MNRWCKSGHKWCKVDHSKYKYINQSVPDKLLTSRSQCSRSIKQESLGPSIFLGNDSLAKISQKIDDLQSRYGVPPVNRQNVSEDLIHPVFSDIWENVLSFKHNVLEKVEKMEKVKPIPILKPKKMALNFGSSVILETRPLVFSKEKSKIKSKSSGFQQSHVPLHDPYSAAADEALFKLAKLNNVDGEEDYDGYPTEKVDEIPVPKPKKLSFAKSSNKSDVPSPMNIKLQ